MQSELKAFEFNDQLIDQIIESSERIKNTIEKDAKRQERINSGLGEPLMIFHFKPKYGKKNWVQRNHTTVTMLMGLAIAVGVYYMVRQPHSLLSSGLHTFKQACTIRVSAVINSLY